MACGLGHVLLRPGSAVPDGRGHFTYTVVDWMVEDAGLSYSGRYALEMVVWEVPAKLGRYPAA